MSERREAGFTLLEMLVATAVMAIAIAGILAALATSTRNAARLTDNDRGALLARRKMDELLVDKKLPKQVWLEGQWDPSVTGGTTGGWRGRITPFEWSPNIGPGIPILERVELEIWWINNGNRRTFTLEGFRRGITMPADIASGAVRPGGS